jgi:hypothetical protein
MAQGNNKVAFQRVADNGDGTYKTPVQMLIILIRM